METAFVCVIKDFQESTVKYKKHVYLALIIFLARIRENLQETVVTVDVSAKMDIQETIVRLNRIYVILDLETDYAKMEAILQENQVIVSVSVQLDLLAIIAKQHQLVRKDLTKNLVLMEEQPKVFQAIAHVFALWVTKGKIVNKQYQQNANLGKMAKNV